MASRRNRTRKKANEEVIVDVVEANEKSGEGFIEENQNLIFGILIGLVLLIGAYMLYKTLVKEPKEKEAIERISQAQFQFAQDSFALALTNPGGGYDGFVELADNYGGTNAGNTAHLYAGISYLQLGQYDKAIEYLEDFSAVGEVSPILKNGLLGDAYAEKNDMDQALNYYGKAVSAGNNQGVTPYYLLKKGMLELKNNDTDGAKDTFEKLKNDYPYSRFSQDAEKYLMRATAVK